MTALTRDDFADRDLNDPLARFGERFELPEGVIYLDGNSLGALPTAVAERIQSVVRDEWGHDLIKSWNVHDWFTLPTRVGDKIARLIGANPGEVVAADSTSVNLFKLLAAAMKMRPERNVIVSEPGNFPTDLYVAQGLGELIGGLQLRLSEPDGLDLAIGDDVAVVMLTHVNYKTGRVHDMDAVTKAAHDAGALMLWDLAHSAGALPVDLNGTEADLAVGCGYKYLNGGPGAPAFLFVAERLQETVKPPLSGWMGHEAPFEFGTDFRPAGGIVRNLCGTPGVLSMVGLDTALDVMLEADMNEIRAKSIALCDAFALLIAQECGGHGFELASPPAAERGSQVSFRHPQGYAIMQALIARGVIGDFRAPDILRFGFTPLYTRHVDVWDAVMILKDIMETGSWDAPQFHARAAVT